MAEVVQHDQQSDPLPGVGEMAAPEVKEEQLELPEAAFDGFEAFRFGNIAKTEEAEGAEVDGEVIEDFWQHLSESSRTTNIQPVMPMLVRVVRPSVQLTLAEYQADRERWNTHVTITCNHHTRSGPCSFTAHSEQDLTEHVKQAHSKRCKLCPFVTTHFGQRTHIMKEHVKISHPEEEFRETAWPRKYCCPECTFKTYFIPAFNRHRDEYHTGLTEEEEEECLIQEGKRARTVVNYAAPADDDEEDADGDNEEEDGVSEDEENLDPDFLLICGKENCAYKTNNPDDFEQHKDLHNGKIPKVKKPPMQLECAKCDYKTMKRDNFRNHQLVHSDIKKYACSKCSYRTVRCNNLKQHEHTHSEKKPHACSECSYSTVHRSVLKAHVLKKHSSEKPGQD